MITFMNSFFPLIKSPFLVSRRNGCIRDYPRQPNEDHYYNVALQVLEQLNTLTDLRTGNIKRALHTEIYVYNCVYNVGNLIWYKTKSFSLIQTDPGVNHVWASYYGERSPELWGLRLIGRQLSYLTIYTFPF